MPFPNEETQFKPGQTGNPKGRPKKIPEIDDLLADVLGNEDGTGAKEILEALLREARKGNVRAAEVLLDRAYGKPTQPVKGDFDGEFRVYWQEPNVGQRKGSTGELPSVQGGLPDNS